MRTETAIRKRAQAEAGLHSLFSTAQHFGLTHDEMLTRRADIFARLKLDKAPEHVRAYLSGVWATLQAQAYSSALVYGGMVEGVFYSTHSDRADYYERNGIAPRDWAENGLVQAKGHYWRPNEWRGVKPFSRMEAAL